MIGIDKYKINKYKKDRYKHLIILKKVINIKI